MKLKNVLLTLIVIVMVPEILLITYLFKINITIPMFFEGDILTLLITHPLFLVILLIVVIMAVILYFALQIR